MKSVYLDSASVQKAIDLILSGACKRVDLGAGNKVYECKNVIRIDLKVEETEGNNG